MSAESNNRYSCSQTSIYPTDKYDYAEIALILRIHAENIWTDAEIRGYNLRRSAENVYPRARRLA